MWEAPEAEFSCELLSDSVRAAVAAVSVSCPTPDGDQATVARDVRWGSELEIRTLDAQGEEASACASYIAKYATKSTEAVGGLTHRLDAGDLRTLRVRPHVRRYIDCAWRLGGEPHLRLLRLRRWAHTLGFRGHCFTKSRRYSTTFTALRRARHDHVLARLHPQGRGDPWGRDLREGASRELRQFQFVGPGYRTLGDSWLAECAAARARQEREIAREELRTVPGGAVRQEDRPRFRRSQGP